mmetsp:Transcript_52072/g.86171  ORF Transcript_52072/g.86171 Transcript_52072/m.86171 type:complete len:287 (+) Transcript_52072:527-1387(+)
MRIHIRSKLIVVCFFIAVCNRCFRSVSTVGLYRVFLRRRALSNALTAANKQFHVVIATHRQTVLVVAIGLLSADNVINQVAVLLLMLVVHIDSVMRIVPSTNTSTSTSSTSSTSTLHTRQQIHIEQMHHIELLLLRGVVRVYRLILAAHKIRRHRHKTKRIHAMRIARRRLTKVRIVQTVIAHKRRAIVIVAATAGTRLCVCRRRRHTLKRRLRHATLDNGGTFVMIVTRALIVESFVCAATTTATTTTSGAIQWYMAVADTQTGNRRRQCLWSRAHSSHFHFPRR